MNRHRIQSSPVRLIRILPLATVLVSNLLASRWAEASSSTPGEPPLAPERVGAAASNGSSLSGTIVGTVFDDRDGNGLRSTDTEPGLSGVTVEIRNAATSTIITTLLTGPTGTFLVPGLALGDYRVSQRPIAGYFTARPTVSVTVEPLQAATANFANLARGVLAGAAFADLNGNGVREVQEQGIPGVTIVLYPPFSAPRTTVTDAKGTYRFQEVEPGQLRVQASVPAGSEPTTQRETTALLVPRDRVELNFGSRPVLIRPPVIVVEPTDLSLDEGETGTLSAIVSGSEPLAYQWFKNETALVLATNRVFSLPASLVEDSGQYHLEVSNAAGAAKSRSAVVTVRVVEPFCRWVNQLPLAPLDASPNADADGDGSANLMEFALGTDPTDPGSVGAIRAVLVPNGAFTQAGLEITFNPQAANLQLLLLASDDLEHWNVIPSRIDRLESTSEFQRVRLIDRTPVIQNEFRFLKFAVALPDAWIPCP